MNIKNTLDILVIGITLVGAMFLFRYASPLVISPTADVQTTNGSVLFSFDKADTILIDTSPEFNNPKVMHAQNNLVVSLNPGRYYWKVKGVREGTIHNITILSLIDLKLKENGNQYEITNGGNVPLAVGVYNNTNLQESLTLSVNEQKNSSGTLFFGRENVNKKI